MPPAVRKALEDIGLGDKEVKVLLVLLEGGPMFAAAIARDAKLNRTTTYGILKELASKGLVSSEQKKGATRYQSIAPELLPAYIERRGRELLEAKEELTKLVPQIQLLRTKGKILPKVRFFEGKEGVEQAYEDKLVNNAGKKLYEFTGMDAGYEKLGLSFIEYFLKRRRELGIHSDYIAPDTPLAREQEKLDEGLLRKVKFIPPEYAMETEISLYDNKVSLTSFSRENPVTVLIEDENIARTMKKIFDYIHAH
jgi:sugar-specific transcriptional regulator TrmB